MDRCKELAQGKHAWVLNHLPDITWSFNIPFRAGSPQDNLKTKIGDAYEMRVMRGIIQEELKPLSYLQTAKQCAQVFYDVLQCEFSNHFKKPQRAIHAGHHWVWKYPEILHRDISQGNIMMREKNGKMYGVLNDWDLATWLNNECDGPTFQFRTGTKPYMAHEQQSVRWEEFRFEEWHWRDDEFLRFQKNGVVHAAPSRLPVSPFFIGFHLWLTRLQERLHRGVNNMGDHNFEAAKQEDSQFETDDDSQSDNLPPFDIETLGGQFSYERVGMILHKFKNEQLTTHGLEWQKILESLSQRDRVSRKRQRE
ncbi:hypothetical protein F5050DRAFT_1872803 [Lentinula boryana]|uniref:Protein kinase domain-containing protein n=1 Tax=Lentinula boryana TaxID=40481 RepID=A0ABQ8PXK4_9AGAR|nr:hypothetical protein F5050DRAFT_1872803 [Lentinula boryana]